MIPICPNTTAPGTRPPIKLGEWQNPLLKEGTPRRIKQMQRFLSLGVEGEVRSRRVDFSGWTAALCFKASRMRYQTGMRSDLPRHAEAEVALHLFDRRSDPSFKRGSDLDL